MRIIYKVHKDVHLFYFIFTVVLETAVREMGGEEEDIFGTAMVDICKKKLLKNVILIILNCCK